MCATAPASASISSVGAGNIGQHVGSGEIRGAGKAAIEMRGNRRQPPERRSRRSRHRARISDDGRGSGGANAPRPCRRAPTWMKAPSRVRRGMRQRIAFAGGGEQQRGAAVGFEIGGVGGKPRHQDHRRAVAVGRDIDERCEGMAGIAVECRERRPRGWRATAPWPPLAARSRPARGHFPAAGRASRPAAERCGFFGIGHDPPAARFRVFLELASLTLATAIAPILPCVVTLPPPHGIQGLMGPGCR